MLILGLLETLTGYIFWLLIVVGVVFIYISTQKGERLQEFKRGIIDSKTDEIILYVSVTALIVFFVYFLFFYSV